MVSKGTRTANFTTPVQESLERVEHLMVSQANYLNLDLSSAIKHLISSGGKRVRPAVTLLVGNLLGGKCEPLVTLSAAIELLHTATLVHDDLIDGALLRRGNDTLNARWTPAATVLTGDFIFAQAAKLAAETNSVDVMHLFAETLAIIVNGEISQLFSQRVLINEAEYKQRIYAKTASMFELASGAAAELSPVSDQVKEDFHSFGRNLGMAFQIVDDILDYSGKAHTVGKPVGNDLKQGLITIPFLIYMQLEPDDPDIQAITGGKGFNESIIDRLVTAIRESEAIEKSYQLADTYIHQSYAIIQDYPENEYKRGLEDLLAYLGQRES